MIDRPIIAGQLKQIANYYDRTIVAIIAIFVVGGAMVFAFYIKMGIVVDRLVAKSEAIRELQNTNMMQSLKNEIMIRDLATMNKKYVEMSDEINLLRYTMSTKPNGDKRK
jgi:3-phosphoglycerate kinase